MAQHQSPRSDRVCAGCGGANPADARFCMTCGAAMAPPSPPAWGSGLKFVTVLFCDLVNSTVLAQQFEPDRWAALLDAYFDVASRALTEHGGRVEKFIGDAVVGVFGLSGDTEDAARAAAAAGRAIADLVSANLPTHSPAGPVEFRVRVAIASGHVATAERASSFVIGPVLNRAARLQSAAPPDGVVVDVSTWLQIREELPCQELEPVPAKGFATPLPAWLVRPAGRPAPVAATTMVNRHEPLRQVLDGVRRRAVAGQSGIVAITGDAGIGKSRLVAQACAQLPAGATAVILRCPRHDDVLGLLPQYLLLGAVQDAAARARPPSGRARVIQVGGVVGGGVSASERAAAQTRADLHRTLLDALVALRGPGSLLLVLDDAHTMSGPLAQLLTELVVEPRLAGTTVLLAGRSEPSQVSADEVIALPALPPSYATQLAESLLDNAIDLHSVIETDPATLASAAGGNPLFIEQLAQLARFGGGGEPPPSAHAAIGARLEALSSHSQGLLALLAVLGGPAAISEVEALAAEFDLPAAISELLRTNFLDGTASRSGQLELLSPLVAEVMIRRLTREQLHRLHAAIAEHLQRSLAHRPSAVELLAHHRHEVFLLLRDHLGAGPDDQAPAGAAAATAWCSAARFALSRGEITAARGAIERAYTAAGDDPVQRAQVQAIEGYVHGHAGDVPQALAVARAGRAAGVPAVRVHSYLNELFAGPHVAGDISLPDAEDVLGLAQRLDDDEALAGAHLFAGLTRMRAGDYVGAYGCLTDALSHADRAPYCVIAPEVYANLGLSAVLGDASVRATVGTCTRICRRSAGSRLLTAVSTTSLALALHQADRYAAARRALDLARQALDDLEHQAGTAQVVGFDAILAARAGQWAVAARSYREQADRYAELGITQTARISRFRAVLAQVAGSGPDGFDPGDGAVDDLPPPSNWEDRVLHALGRAAASVAGRDRDAVTGHIGQALLELEPVRGAGARTWPLLTALRMAGHGADAGFAGEIRDRLRQTLGAKGDRGVVLP